MREFSPEDRRKAAEQLADARYGTEKLQPWRDAQVQTVLDAFDADREPNMTIHISHALNIQCQLNAAVELLRRAQHALPDERWKLTDSIDAFLADFPVPEVETKR